MKNNGLDRLDGAVERAGILCAAESAGSMKALAGLAESVHTAGQSSLVSLERV